VSVASLITRSVAGRSVWEIKRSRDFRAIRKSFSFSSWKKFPLVYSPIPRPGRFLVAAASPASAALRADALERIGAQLAKSRRALCGRTGKAKRRLVQPSRQGLRQLEQKTAGIQSAGL